MQSYLLIIKIIFLIILMCGCGLSLPKSGIILSKDTRMAAIASVTPPVAKPAETITLAGNDLQPGKAYTAIFKLADGATKSVRLTVVNETTASFPLPDGLGLGEKTFDVVIGARKINTFSIVADNSTNTLPIITAGVSEICSTTSFIDKTGAQKVGTKDCALGTVADCKTDGELGCKTIAAFPAASISNAVAGNIKAGVSIAGVAGAYPSVTHPLAGADGTADLSDNQGTREAQLRSATSFEFFKSDGTRVVAAGDADIDDATNIKNLVVMFGRTGSYTGAAAPDPWDLRRGVTVAGVTGKLYVNCRNRSRADVYNYDGAVGSIPNTANTAGATPTFDYWDTIDDYNNNVTGLPNQIIPGWADNDCQGKESSLGDDKVWKDVTTTGDGTTASDCATTPAHCTMKDKITGLQWSKQDMVEVTATTNASTTITVSSATGLVSGMSVSGAGIALGTSILSIAGSNVTISPAATASGPSAPISFGRKQPWNTAINYCDSLIHNGATNWRLPTQKELLDAYNHGIKSAASIVWIPEGSMHQDRFWSASSVSAGTGTAPGTSSSLAASPTTLIRPFHTRQFV